MRTTLRIDDRLLQEAKTLAARTGRTLTAVVEDALREILNRRKEPKRKPKICLTTVSGKGLQDGVDLDHSAELLDHMEQTHASD
jgi:hypothetical protein